MTFGIERHNSFSASDHRPLPPAPQRVLGGVALAILGLLCAWTIYDLVGAGSDRMDEGGSRGDRLAVAVAISDRGATRGDKLTIAYSPLKSLDENAWLFEPRFALEHPATFADNAVLGESSGSSSAAPSSSMASDAVPVVRTRQSRIAQLAANAAAIPARLLARSPRNPPARDSAQGNQAAPAPAEKPTFAQTIFEKLFGKPAPVTLAYAATDDAGLTAEKRIAGRYDRWTAVYDISAHVVYMPDGRQLEAHSGLGDRLDDPSHADERMHGVTPPNLYDLELREAPFHGVRALRMIPQEQDKTYGRTGILAHTYMLGPNGDSNGCVSFKNYDAFLQAYLNHEVKRLAVVARLD
jgi:hypothetical protein